MAKAKPKAADPARPSDALPPEAAPPPAAAQDPAAGPPGDPIDSASESTETQPAAPESTAADPAEAPAPPATPEVSPEPPAEEAAPPAPKPKVPERIRKRLSRQDRLAELHRLATMEAARAGLEVDDYVARTIAAKLGREDLATDDLTHEPSETYCSLNNHNDGDPRPCVFCRHCNQKLRPRQLTEPCQAR